MKALAQRWCAALAAASVAGVIAAFAETAWVRSAAAEPPPHGATLLLTLALLAPLALLVGAGVALASWFLHPVALPSAARLTRALRADVGGRRRYVAALLPLVFVAATAWLIVAARVALAFLATPLRAGVAGSALALTLGAVTLLACATALGGARLLANGVARRWDPVVSGGIGALFFALVIGAAIATGTTSGAGSLLSIFGVLKRPELDLRGVLVLLGVAGAAYLLPALSVRIPLWLNALIAVAPLSLLFIVAASDVARATSLATERGGALSKLGLALARRTSDADRDRYSGRFGGGDCDDADPRRNPGAEDVPGNGIDEDCSGSDAREVVLEKPAAAPPKDAAAWMRQKLPAKPNVILITVDTLRYDLGYMGNPRKLSPNIDALAARSTVFERAYALASYTSKSLPPMMIGKFTSETHRGWAHFNRFGKQDTFVQERLQKAGIRTISVQGYWYFFNAGYGFERGFDVIDSSAAPKVAAVEGDRSFNSHKISDAAIAQLEKPENTASQFFMWVHYIDPHSEYAKHEGFEFGPKPRDAYDGEVAFVDQQVGRVLDFVAKGPLAASTAVVFTSDHGEAFGEHGMIRHGFEVWEELVRVPLLVHVPGGPGHRVSEPRSVIDVVPTLLDIYGLPPPSGEQFDFVSGQSLLPDVLLPPGHKPAPRLVLVDMSAGPHNAERQAFIDGRLKLIASAGRALGLYDLSQDPAEKKDLLDDAALKEQALARFKAFKKQLREVIVRPE